MADAKKMEVSGAAAAQAAGLKIVVIGDSAMVAGFRLAGVAEAYISEGQEAERTLVSLLDRGNVGIIIIPEVLLTQLDWRLKERLEALARPVVLAVPDKGGPSLQAESLREMIKRALGFELGV